MLIIRCPSCGNKMQAKEGLIGRKVQCPNCSGSLVVKAVRDTPLDGRPGVVLGWVAALALIGAFGGGWLLLRPAAEKTGAIAQAPGDAPKKERPKRSRSKPLMPIPKDAVAVVSLRVGDWIQGQESRIAQKSQAHQKVLADLELHFMLPPESLDEVQAAFFTPVSIEKGMPYLHCIAMNQPIDFRELIKDDPHHVAKQVAGKKYFVDSNDAEKGVSTAVYPADDQTWIAGPEETLRKYLAGELPLGNAPLEKAFAKSENDQVVLAASLEQGFPANLLRFLPDTLADFRKLPEEAKTVRLNLRDKDQSHVTLEFDFASTQSAIDFSQKINAAVSKLIDWAKSATLHTPTGNTFLAIYKKAAPTIRVQADGPMVHAEVTLPQSLAEAGPVLWGMMYAPTEPALTIIEQMKKARDIVVAMRQYESQFSSLPAPSMGKGLSWRVFMLPYLGERQLYEQFKRDEPWDSAHNKALIDKMPPVFRSTNPKSPPGQTPFQLVVGKHAVFRSPEFGSRSDRISDGLSNTLMLIEAGQSVIWTKPDDVVLKSDKANPDNFAKEPLGPLPPLGDVDSTGFVGVLADGEACFLRHELATPYLMSLLICPDDAVPLPVDWHAIFRLR